MYLSSQREKRTNDGRFDNKTLGHWADLDVVLSDISIFVRQNAEGPTQTKTLRSLFKGHSLFFFWLYGKH
jgi:hypothetical protein